MGLAHRAHYLKYNKSNAKPMEFVFLDIETTHPPEGVEVMEQTFKFGSALYWRRQPTQPKDTIKRFDFDNRADIWSWVDRLTHSKSRLILVSHNIEFDFMGASGFENLVKLGWQLDMFYSKGRVGIFKFSKDSRSLQVIDNQNIFSGKLSTLGDMVGLPKLPMPDDNASADEWRAYNYRDVDILHKLWAEWLNMIYDNNLGYFGLTIGSQAFHAFNHRFRSYDILHHTFDKAIMLERAAYRGGRVECFHLGKQPVANYYSLDVNSMYASVMCTHEYPTEIIHHMENVTLTELKRELKTHCVIAEVLLKTSHNAYNVKYNKRGVYPLGTFRVSLTTEELKFAILEDTILKIYQINTYKKAPIFNSYVDFFWSERARYEKEGNKTYKQITKLFLNSLYGKFGQQIVEWKSIEDCPGEPDRVEDWLDADTGETYQLKYVCGRCFRSGDLREAQNNFAAIAAEVTANARLRLYRLYRDFPDDTYYCDTDSLIVNEKAYAAIVMGQAVNTDLGGLKVDKTGRSLNIRAPKDYQLGKYTRIKGIKKNAIQTGDNIYAQYEQEGFEQALRKGNINKMIWHKKIKHLSRSYFGGITLQSNQVKPLILKYQSGQNELDLESMRTCYGDNARYGKQFLPNVMNFSYKGEVLNEY